jgi:hypothetical protein
MVRYLFLLMSLVAMAFPAHSFADEGDAKLTVYSLNGTSGAWSDASNIDRTATAQRTGHMGTNIEVSVPSGSDVRVGGHITVDAEL